MKSGALQGPCGAGGARSRVGATGASLLALALGVSRGPTGPRSRAGCSGMDAAGDAGCPSNGCYGKRFLGEISSHIHVSVIVLGTVPDVWRARHGLLRTGQAAAMPQGTVCARPGFSWLFLSFPSSSRLFPHGKVSEDPN